MKIRRVFFEAGDPVRGKATARAVASSTAAVKGETEVLENNIWFVNSTTPESRVFGFRWTPGLWARAKVESSETNSALFQRIKSVEVTPRDLFNLTGLGFSMWAAFLVGSMVGKWKIFGYRGQAPHHGHDFWTDAPTHH